MLYMLAFKTRGQCSRKIFYSNFPRETNDSKLTFLDQRIKKVLALFSSSQFFLLSFCQFGFFFWWNTLFGIRETKFF